MTVRRRLLAIEPDFTVERFPADHVAGARERQAARRRGVAARRYSGDRSYSRALALPFQSMAYMSVSRGLLMSPLLHRPSDHVSRLFASLRQFRGFYARCISEATFLSMHPTKATTCSLSRVSA